MNYSYPRQKCGHELRGTVPRYAIPLAASAKRPPPEISDVVPKRTQALGIGRHRMVRKVTTHHLPQPSALLNPKRPFSPILFLNELTPRATLAALPEGFFAREKPNCTTARAILLL
jgi:hypothetical protein